MKTTSTTLWGKFSYIRILLRLMNVGATFQRAMNYAFDNTIYIFIVISLHDMIVFSKKVANHLGYSRKLFKRCRKFGISLNPKRYLSMMVEGKLLNHTLSSQGENIDMKGVEAIKTIFLPRQKKAIQPFFGKIKFLQRFIHNFVGLTNHDIRMLKRHSKIRWDDPAKETFIAINKSMGEIIILISPNYNKVFMIFYFDS